MTDYRAAGWWRNGSVLDDLRRAVARTPDKTALVCDRGGVVETVTYAALARRVERIAANLRRLGTRRGDVVTLQLPNSWQLIATCLACARLGAVAGPVVPIMRRREVEFMVRLTGSPVYVAAAEFRGFSYARMSREVADRVPTLRHRVLLASGDDGRDPGALDFERELLEYPAPEIGLDRTDAAADDPAQLMFTSGTTGEPKGVLHSHNTLYAINKAQADILGLAADEVTAMGSPTTHQAGYTWNFLMPLQLGATSLHVDIWDPGRMLELFETHRVSFFMGAPVFLDDLVAAQRAAGRDLAALRVLATGSAPIPPSVVEATRVVLGCRVYALWGMTENGCVTITRPEDPVLRAAESDGRAVPGMEVRIVDPATGTPAAPGTSGLLQVRGAAQCLGYFARPEVYAEAITPDGWFDTGDLARDDGHGGVRITGRVKDVIMRGAENVPVVEVEAALLRHRAIREVAVVGYPDRRLGERACAVVVPDGAPPTLETLLAHLDALGMAKQHWPERLEIVDNLPRTPSGKIQKFALRSALRAA